MSVMIDRLKEHFKNTTPEERQTAWVEIKNEDLKGPTVDTFTEMINSYDDARRRESVFFIVKNRRYGK